MTGPVLAVDQGTSGTKALVVCPVRGVIGSASAPVRPRYLPGGRVEVDPVTCWTRSSTRGAPHWRRRRAGGGGGPGQPGRDRARLGPGER